MLKRQESACFETGVHLYRHLLEITKFKESDKDYKDDYSTNYYLLLVEFYRHVRNSSLVDKTNFQIFCSIRLLFTICEPLHLIWKPLRYKLGKKYIIVSYLQGAVDQLLPTLQDMEVPRHQVQVAVKRTSQFVDYPIHLVHALV
jgi:hypothetical protein